MGAVVAWIAQAFTGLLAFEAGRIAKRLAIIAAVISGLAAAVAALTVTINGAITSVIVSAPGGAVAQGLALLPSNTPTCVGAIITAHGAAWLYRKYYLVLTMKIV